MALNLVATPRPFVLSFVAVVALLMTTLLAGKAPKGKTTEKESPADVPAVTLPEDLNDASLQVAAIDTIYELDLTTAQLQLLRTAAAGAANSQHRIAPKADPKLASALADLAGALLNSKDDTHIAELRNQVVELSNGETTRLDDEVHSTSKAKAIAPDICRKWTASQIAAYLASHADEIVDPGERMVGALSELHDSSEGSVANSLIHDTADEVTQMVVGNNEAKAAALSAKVSDWLKSNRELKDEELATRGSALQESATKVLGDVSPMDVLSHRIEKDAAELLSNPQLPNAIDATLAAKQPEN